jgi:threonine/homoserine/homoserine lactone efflux protein
MLSGAIGELLPAAVAVALSPIPIVAVIVMLGTPKARTNGPAFALGWVVGLVAVSVIVLVLANGADDPNSTSADTVEWGKVVLGAALIVMAFRQWRKRPRHGEAAQMPGWMAVVDRFTPARSLVLGIGLSAVNPKNLVLTAAAAAAIAQAGLSTGDTAIAVLVFVVIASVTVVGSVLLFVVAPHRAERPLAVMKEFMAQHNAVIMMIVLLVIGAKLLGDGIGGVGS